ncbi:MAG: dienelactone hydrolase family protein [Nitrospiria bacterium]
MKKTMLSLLLCLTVFTLDAQAVVQTQEIQYKVNGKSYTGFLAVNDAVTGPRPGILVVHEWWGHDAYARKRAEILAALGYTAFALDMYGTGKLADHPDDAKKFMQAAVGQSIEMNKRFEAAYEVLINQKTVDRKKIAAIGYCMGGGIVLHAARTGLVDLEGVVSFHGNLQLGTQAPKSPGPVKARVLAFTGAADPFVPVEQVQAFVESMTSDGVQFGVVSYPGAKHSFTVPHADSLGKRVGLPLAYDRDADQDSWNRMQGFLNEIFNKPAKDK